MNSQNTLDRHELSRDKLKIQIKKKEFVYWICKFSTPHAVSNATTSIFNGWPTNKKWMVKIQLILIVKYFRRLKIILKALFEGEGGEKLNKLSLTKSHRVTSIEIICRKFPPERITRLIMSEMLPFLLKKLCDKSSE